LSQKSLLPKTERIRQPADYVSGNKEDKREKQRGFDAAHDVDQCEVLQH